MPTADELLSAGTALRFATIGTYAGAFVGYAASIAVKKLRVALLATVLAVIGATAHTAYLASRWIAAGQIEIAAREATGDVLTAANRFWYLISHPPYTNLFDALNFTGWALMVCYLLVQRRWGLHVVGALTTAVALVTMGEASLVADKGIEPLVPALQSYWIHLRDGTGREGTDDLTVTSEEICAVGDVVLARGTARVDQDFGAGYRYPVLLEGARLQAR